MNPSSVNHRLVPPLLLRRSKETAGGMCSPSLHKALTGVPVVSRHSGCGGKGDTRRRTPALGGELGARHHSERTSSEVEFRGESDWKSAGSRRKRRIFRARRRPRNTGRWGGGSWRRAQWVSGRASSRGRGKGRASPGLSWDLRARL